NPSWVNSQSAGRVSFQLAPTDLSILQQHGKSFDTKGRAVQFRREHIGGYFDKATTDSYELFNIVDPVLALRIVGLHDPSYRKQTSFVLTVAP
ncbi:hypothetical protein, partial [Pseudomonas syringae]|uniref:hypothetical protein n=1 Tax=Pseudomonas syringae TaxID=317 RepID=UPI001C816572